MKRFSVLTTWSLLIFSLSGMTMDRPIFNERFNELFSRHTDALTVHSSTSTAATPSQPEGPFYRRTREHDVDLTIVGNGPKAQGIEVRMKGRVLNLDGTPIEGARVEIWQASKFGTYNHPRDPHPGPRDRKFQGYGEDRTNAQGEYSFITIIPGAYPAGSNWVRPPHIHVIVTTPNGTELTTQMYFAGSSLQGMVCELNGREIDGNEIDVLNSADRLLQSVDARLRSLLVVPFNNVDGHLVGEFNIYIPQ